MHDTIAAGANIDRSIKLKLERLRARRGAEGLSPGENLLREQKEATEHAAGPFSSMEPPGAFLEPPFKYIPPQGPIEAREILEGGGYVPRSEFDKDLVPRRVFLGLGSQAEKPLKEEFKAPHYP